MWHIDAKNSTFPLKKKRFLYPVGMRFPRFSFIFVSYNPKRVEFKINIMIYAENNSMKALIMHRIGNRGLDEGYIISDKCIIPTAN